jgi:hypothetical protein
MAALDPENRDLRNYFDGVLEPEGYAPEEVAKWLEDFLAYLMKTKGSALLDMGGGDTSLGTVVAQNPDICQILEDGGVTPVALYMIAPRVESLSPLATMEAADFQPKATALILNDGLEDATVPRERKFRDVLKHPAFRAALDRGAVQLWMPAFMLRRKCTAAGSPSWRRGTASCPKAGGWRPSARLTVRASAHGWNRWRLKCPRSTLGSRTNERSGQKAGHYARPRGG